MATVYPEEEFSAPTSVSPGKALTAAQVTTMVVGNRTKAANLRAITVGVGSVGAGVVVPTNTGDTIVPPPGLYDGVLPPGGAGNMPPVTLPVPVQKTAFSPGGALVGGVEGYLSSGWLGAVLGAVTGSGLLDKEATGMTYGSTGAAGMVPYGGPGVPEPAAGLVARQWKTKAFANDVGEYWVYFFRLIDGRIMCWNERRQEMKIWRPKKNIVISSDPRISSIVKLERTYNRVIRRLAKKSKALKLQK